MRICPSCGAAVQPSARFCPSCAAPLERICPRCGAAVSPRARFCDSCGAPLTAPEEEERKLITALFADLIGSTSLGERLDPERLRSLLSAYFSAMSAVIESWGGTVEKFIGDAVVAVFGAPVVREDDPDRALRAALGMLDRLEELNKEFQARHGITVQLRIGVNTGEVIAPAGGHLEQQIVTGDAVNVAARLQQVADPGTVLVGQRTFLATRDAFDFDEPALFELKGKAGAVEARRLVSPREEAQRGIPGLRSAMVGRDRELDILLGQLEEALETERPRQVIVFGPAGIGKSRLVLEFVRVAAARYSGLTILRGRCLAAGQGVTYWALAEVLRAACDIGLDDPGEAAGTKLRARLRDPLHALGLSPDDVERTVFALATTAGIALRDNPLDRLEPREVADELSRAWPRFASALASTGPSVLVVEDLHWGEDRLLEMLERILARTEGPLVVVATARPEFAEAHSEFAAGRENSSSVSLRPLTAEQSGKLVRELLSVADLPSAWREEILSRAEGNPFFIEEILRRLIDEGALIREGERWRAAGSTLTVPLPDTIHGLLAARIDGLPRDEKRVLQEAAVVGRVFWQQPVAKSMGDGAVDRALLSLERRGLVFARPTSSIAGQVEYMFKHALVRDVAYASLPKARRARAHAEHGDWIREFAGDRIEEFAELLAHHFRTAATGEDADLAWSEDPSAGEDVRSKAFEALLLAGRVVRKRFAIDRAVELHESALALADSEQGRARALEELGDDHAAAFHGDEAVEWYLRALDVVRSDPAASDGLARLCVKAARMAAEKSGAFRVLPDPDWVDGLIREGLEATTDPESRGWLHALSGANASYWRGTRGRDPISLQERIRSTEEAMAAAEQLDRPELLTFSARILSELQWWAGSPSLALETSRRQLEVVDRIDSASERALILFEVANSLMDFAGEYEQAITLAERSYELAKELSPHELMHATFAWMGALYNLGRWSEMAPLLEEHLGAFAAEADVACYAVRGGPIVGAIVLAHRGEPERARQIAEMEAIDKQTARPRLLAELALLGIALGDAASAREYAEEAWRQHPDYQEVALAMVEHLVAAADWDALEDILPETTSQHREIQWLRPMFDRAGGLLDAARGRESAAVTRLREALVGFLRLRMPFEAARTREALASVIGGSEGTALLEAALATYDALGAAPHAERARQRLTAAR